MHVTSPGGRKTPLVDEDPHEISESIQETGFQAGESSKALKVGKMEATEGSYSEDFESDS